MSEVHEAAKRKQRLKNGEDLVTVYCPKMPDERHTQMAGVIAAKLRAADCERLAEWALPLLDGEPTTEDWLRSVGFEERGESLTLHASSSPLGHLRHTQVSFGLVSGNWFANGLGCAHCKTRGDVRRLCAALGITLKEQPTNS